MGKFKALYNDINKTAFWVCLSISVILMVIAFFTPPTAVIDASVIGAVGELFGFSALGTVVTAIEKGRSVTVTKGNTNITVGDDNDDTKELEDLNDEYDT